MAIKSFHDNDTQSFWRGARVARLQSFEKAAMRKLQMLHAAPALAVLAAVPGNKLEKLTGDRDGQHSLRINDKWRLCFRWKQPDAYDVEITNHYA
ncbi:MAG: type II toxin-antitoxin system RelE/ParE family toxin [Candidatus Binataceae bacterium]